MGWEGYLSDSEQGEWGAVQGGFCESSALLWTWVFLQRATQVGSSLDFSLTSHSRVMTSWITALILLTILHSEWSEQSCISLPKQVNIQVLGFIILVHPPLHTHRHTQENEPCCPLPPLTHRVQGSNQRTQFTYAVYSILYIWTTLPRKWTECWSSSASALTGWSSDHPALPETLQLVW